jgi:hypothetical protein
MMKKVLFGEWWIESSKLKLFEIDWTSLAKSPPCLRRSGFAQAGRPSLPKRGNSSLWYHFPVVRQAKGGAAVQSLNTHASEAVGLWRRTVGRDFMINVGIVMRPLIFGYWIIKFFTQCAMFDACPPQGFWRRVLCAILLLSTV